MYQVWPVLVASTVPAAVWLQPRLRVLTLQDLLTLFCYHWVVICLTLILRNLSRLQQEAESLGQRWAQEVEKRDKSKGSKKRRQRRR